MDSRLSGDLPPGNATDEGTASIRAASCRDRAFGWWAGPAACGAHAGQISLPATIAIFLAAFVLTTWPWLSGHVTIPWDAKSQSFPQVQFLATSIARGEWPWWTPNVFAGWPQISDPQSLLFSPLHVLLALFNPAVSLRAFDAVVFAYLALAGIGIILFFHDRGWHAGGAVVAALAFALGGAASARIQHVTQVISLAYFPWTLWLLARALERSSWRAGLAAGVFGGLLALGRDQVALLCVYVLGGYVLAFWLTGSDVVARLRASLKPLSAGALSGAIVTVFPVVMTSLLAARSNRPEVSFDSAAAGSIHPVHLLQLVFADLFGAMDPKVPYWAPPSPAWDAVWGWPGLYLSQNMPLVYAGALPILAIVALGVIRGIAFDRDIRFFTIAALLMMLYALGAYTPAFHLMFELPFVSLYRRAADATFVFCGLLAIVAGYLVHRWLSGTVAPASRLQRAIEIAVALLLIGTAFAVAAMVVGIRPVIVPVVTALAFTAAAIAILALSRRADPLMPTAAVALLALFMAADLRWNNAPHESTALPRERYDALRQNTADQTVHVLKQRLAAAAAPDRRDRVELIGVGYHWPNLGLARGLDHVFGHNPLRLRWFYDATHVGDTVALGSQRQFSPLYPSYRSAFANLFGVRFIATGIPIEQIDTSLKPGDLELVDRTDRAYIYENPHALPRVMLFTDWRLADFDDLIRNGWPDVDPARTVLLKRAPAGIARVSGGAPGTARLVRYTNTEVDVDVDAPFDQILVLNDVWHPWWRASVDGVPTEILKANVIFRAVLVPRGHHTVRFTFHPFSGAFAELFGKVRHAP